jgi:hypothetical protein
MRPMPTGFSHFNYVFHCILLRVSLPEGSYIYNSLHDKLNRGKEAQDVKNLKMARVSNFSCPINLDKIPPTWASRVHIHPSNGVIIAVDGQIIYYSCSECRFEEDRGQGRQSDLGQRDGGEEILLGYYNGGKLQETPVLCLCYREKHSISDACDPCFVCQRVMRLVHIIRSLIVAGFGI